MSTLHRFVSLFLVVALVAASGPALAQESTTDDGEMKTLLDEGVALYNENVEQFDLSFAAGLIAGKTVNVYVEDGDETHVFSAVVEDDMQIRDVETEPNPDASTRITTDRATLESIASASNPGTELEDAIRDDRIRVSGEDGHLVDQAVWAVTNVLKGLLF